MFRRAFAILSAFGCVSLAVAGPQTYALRVQTVHAGIVILDSAKQGSNQPQSAGPFAWYNLDSAAGIKPAGWNFDNPFAPSVVSQAIFDRYTALSSSTGSPSLTPPPVGSQMGKNNAPYWEVFLDSTDDTSLSAYDILLVNPTAFASLNTAEQSKLRRFVDQGGVLWIDPANASIDAYNNFPLAFATMSPGLGGMPSFDISQPLLNVPDILTPQDVFTLDGGASNMLGVLSDPSAAAGPLFLAAGSQFQQYESVIWFNNGGPTATTSIARIGDGFIVVTARGASMMLNRAHAATTYSGTPYSDLTKTGANNGYTALRPFLDGDGIAAGKLAVNMAQLRSEARQTSGGSRKSNSTSNDLGAPLLGRFAYTKASNGPVPLPSAPVNGTTTPAPVFYKGVVVISVGNTIAVFKASPGTDLDGDGDPDDGIADFGSPNNYNPALRDYSVGKGYDLIWSQTFQGVTNLSAPVCVEVPKPVLTTDPVDQVLVLDDRGVLHRLDLFMKNSATHQLMGSGVDHQLSAVTSPSGDNYFDNGIPLAPTVHEGLIYITDNIKTATADTGRLWVVDASQGAIVQRKTQQWSVGGSRVPGLVLPLFTASPTIGYIPIYDNSGGSDKVLYAPFDSTTGVGAGFLSIWLGTRGEVPSSVTYVGQKYEVVTRAGGTSGLPIDINSVKLTFIDKNGNPLSAAAMAGVSQATQSGAAGTLDFTVPFDPNDPTNPLAPLSPRIDYDIDLGSDLGATTLQNVVRGRVNLPVPGGTTSNQKVLGSLALNSRGNLFLSYGGNGNSGGVWGFREEGRGLFKAILRYDLYPYQPVLGSINGTTFPADQQEVVCDTDPVNQFLANMNLLAPSGSVPLGHFTSVQIAGSPAVSGDQVFVTALGNKGSAFGQSNPIPNTVLLVLNGNPQPAQFRISNLPDGSSLVQGDYAKGFSPSNPSAQSAIQSGQFSYDSDSGLIQLDNLMSTPNGPIQGCINLSSPVILRRPGLSDTLIQPESIGGTWSPLLWYTVRQGLTAVPINGPPVGTPFVSGNTVFYAGSSALPSLLVKGFTLPITYTGILSANDSQISSNDPWLFTAPETNSSFLSKFVQRPWQSQLWQIKNVSTGQPIAASPHQRWPQYQGIANMDDFRTRILQSTLPGTTVALGVAGGEGVLVSWGDGGIYGYNRADFTVCDEGRVARFDPAGNPIFVATGSLGAGSTNSSAAGQVTPLVKPSRAYPQGNRSLLVVDPGSNRVVLFDEQGIEQRSISQFRVDPAFFPDGYSTGESVTLNGPRDVATYTNYVTAANNSLSNPSQLERWTHYLIADAGNQRLIEVVDRYVSDQNGNVSAPVQATDLVTGNPVAQIGVLIWHSPANVSGHGFSYNSVTRVYLPPPTATTKGRYVYVAGVGDARATRASVGLDSSTPQTEPESHAGSGSVVIFDSAAAASGGSVANVISSLSMTDVSGVPFWSTGANQWVPAAPRSTDFVRRAMPHHQLTGLNSVTASVVINQQGNPDIAVMVTDSTGVYEFLGGDAHVQWMLPNDAYLGIRHTEGAAPVSNPSGSNRPLRAVYARRLDNNDVLIVNDYQGKTLGGADTLGEVIEIDGSIGGGVGTGSFGFNYSNLGFNAISIRYQLENTTGVRKLQLPSFADRR